MSSPVPTAATNAGSGPARRLGVPASGAVVAAVLLGLPGVSAAIPAGPAADTVQDGGTPISNGDGRLSGSELARIDAAPVAELDGADLADVHEADLDRLPADVRDAIQTPVRVIVTEGPNGPTGRADRESTQDSVAWHMMNNYGWELADYHIAARWSFDGTKVYDPTSWTWAGSNWGWQVCTEDEQREWWANSDHTVWKVSSRGGFGRAGCGGTLFSLGGTAAVSRKGNMWVA